MAPRQKNVLDAFVTKATIRGAAEALDAILIELEMRGHRVQLSPDSYSHRPPVDVAQRPIKVQCYCRPKTWQPHRPTIAYVRDATIALTPFELTEHVRVRRTGADRFVRISDLPLTRRHAPRLPVKRTRPATCPPAGSSRERIHHDMTRRGSANGRNTSRAGSVTMANAIADAPEAFFTELARRASALDGDTGAHPEARIQTAPDLAGGQDAVDRFLKVKPPSSGASRDLQPNHSVCVRTPRCSSRL